MVMPPSRNYPPGLKAAVTVAFIFFLTFLSLKSVGSSLVSGSGESEDSLFQKKTVLGSKPPGCVNKCLNCRPCMATLVIPSHQKIKGLIASSRGEDDTYYHLSWKCRCGNKLFQP